MAAWGLPHAARKRLQRSPASVVVSPEDIGSTGSNGPAGGATVVVSPEDIGPAGSNGPTGGTAVVVSTDAIA